MVHKGYYRNATALEEIEAHTMDKTGKQKIARMEAALRNSNYRVAESQVGDPLSELFCECGKRGCQEHLSIPVADYDRVRVNKAWFLCAPGHQLVESEALVEDHTTWIVVEKPEDIQPTIDAIDVGN